MLVVGIDVGLTGAVAILGDPPVSHEMPTVALSKTGFVKNTVDTYGLARCLHDYGVLGAPVFIERVNAFPGQGVSSMFSLGMSFGAVLGVCAALGLEVHLVEPRAWKKHFRLGPDKEQARGLASRLFPKVDLSRKKDHGRAEALLIARYGQEMTR